MEEEEKGVSTDTAEGTSPVSWKSPKLLTLTTSGALQRHSIRIKKTDCLRHGQFFPPQATPKTISATTGKNCFDNAFRLARLTTQGEREAKGR